MTELVIFDLDGILVDTQEAENGALGHLAGLMGLPTTLAEANEMFSGKRMQECIDLLEERSGHPPPAGAMRLVRDRCEELIGGRLDPLPGVAAALDRISVPKCVASNSPGDIIERRLRAAGVLHHFGGRLFSAYDVDAWKPDPRLFLWAAAECGADAARCVVIEDSEVGVAAGVDAGMRVLQYTTRPGAGPHRPGAHVFTDMADLPGLLAGQL